MDNHKKSSCQDIFNNLKNHIDNKQITINTIWLAVIALEFKQNIPDSSDKQCIDLSERIMFLQDRQDEPAFSLYDYADAICNHNLSLSIKDLLASSGKNDDEMDIWDNFIIHLTKSKREFYTTSKFDMSVEQKLRELRKKVISQIS